ncbi:MAG: hypothetical protein ACTHOP_23870 [Mesorhizobium sp.]
MSDNKPTPKPQSERLPQKPDPKDKPARDTREDPAPNPDAAKDQQPGKRP